MRESTKRERRVMLASRILLAATVSTLLAATLVAASTSDLEPSLAKAKAPTIAELSSGDFTCTIQHLAVANERQQRIAGAATLEEARDLALGPVHAAKRALQLAVLVAPSSPKLEAAREKLDGFEARVQQQDTPSAVAGEFGRLLNNDMDSGNLVQVADLNVHNANVRGPGGCHYTTGEIVAVVFGFILFIIPGIVLLIVLC